MGTDSDGGREVLQSVVCKLKTQESRRWVIHADGIDPRLREADEMRCSSLVRQERG
jgi:hypothetical protein